MPKITDTLLDRVEKQDQFSIKAARALLDKARNNKKDLIHSLSRLAPILRSNNLNLRAVTAGILGYVNTPEALDLLLEEIETTPWSELSVTAEQSEGLSDEPLYYWYTCALAESLGGNEPTTYGMKLLEYLVRDEHTKPEVRSKAMDAMYYALSSFDSYHISSDTTHILLKLCESDNDDLVNASLQLLGEIDESPDNPSENSNDHSAESNPSISNKKSQGMGDSPSNATADEVLKNINPHLPNRLQALSGQEFEKFMRHAFERIGYRVTMTPATNDFGADLILDRDNQKIAVQLKRYADSKVGNAAVGAIVGAMAHYQCTKSMVITTSYFTRQAAKLAESNKVDLWDWDILRKNLGRILNL